MPATVWAEMILHSVRIGVMQTNPFCRLSDSDIYPISIELPTLIADEQGFCLELLSFPVILQITAFF